MSTETDSSTVDSEARAKSHRASDGRTLAVVGMVLGGAIGAAVALVFSRGTGEQNRADLSKWAHHRLEDLQSKVDRTVTGGPPTT